MNSRTDSRQTFRRQVSALERLSYRMPNANVVMVARIQGKVTGAQMSNAVAKVRERHPLLGARIDQIDRDGDGHAWFTTQNVPEIPVRVLPRDRPDEWLAQVVNQMRTPFCTGQGPLISFTLLHAPERSDLVVCARHNICDGLSMVYLVRDLMQHLGDPDRAVERLPDPPPPGPPNVPVSVSGNVVERLMLKLINWRWKRKGISFGPEDYGQLHDAFWKTHRNRVLAWKLTPAQTDALVTRCRQARVTVNTALLTAFVAAQHDVQGTGTAYLHDAIVAVDFRERLIHPPGEAFGLYASAVRPELDYDPGAPFWHTARRFHAAITGLLTDEHIFASQRVGMFHPGLLDALAFARNDRCDDDLVTKLHRRTGNDRVNTRLLISNLGRVDIPTRYGPLELDGMYGPFVYPDVQEKYLGVVTTGGALHFALSFGETIIDPATVEKVKDAAMRHLGQAVGWETQERGPA
jgi:NRPS condensation-like uncharacterized protein